MRIKNFIRQGWYLGIIFLIGQSPLSAQTAMTFKYGEREEYEGRLTAYLFMLGQDKVSKERVSRLLTEKNHSVELSKYDQLMIVLQLTDLELAESAHYQTCWLEMPVRSYFNQEMPGLDLISKTVVVTIGGDSIPQARQTADIRFAPAEDLQGSIAGKVDFSFDFISSEFPWRKITFQPEFSYVLEGAFPTSAEEKSTKKLKESMLSADDGPAELEKIPASAAATEAEVDLMLDIQKERDPEKVLLLCEKYRRAHPNGHFSEEVLYKQLSHEVDVERKAGYLETYLKRFPEGKYIKKVNEMILAEFPEIFDGFPSPKEKADANKPSITADIQVTDGILAVNNIEGGRAPYRLEFYEVDQPDLKSYVLYLGESQAFQTDLTTLPLEKNKYIIGLVDAAQSTPYLTEPLSVRFSDRRFKVEGSFIFMVLGGAILTVALFLLLISNFFRKKRRRKRGYYSRSYR